MTIIKATGHKFEDQNYFQNFNWNLFRPGDIVWLEDYEAKDSQTNANIAGVFTKQDGDYIFIKVLPNLAARIISKRGNIININSLSGSYWKTILL